MKWITALLILGVGSASFAESTKTVFNPFTGKLDFITKVDTGTVLSGSAFRTADVNSCLWDISVSTPGNLITTLVSCPAAAQAGRGCSTGMPLGLLLAITCK